MLIILPFVIQRLQYFHNLRSEISTLRVSVPMNLICLDCVDINEILFKKLKYLQDQLLQFLIDENRETNKRSFFAML